MLTWKASGCKTKIETERKEISHANYRKKLILSSVNKAMTVIPEKKCSLCQFGPQNVYVLILFSFVIFKGLDSVSFYASCPTFIFPSNWFLELNRRFKMSTDQESSIHSKHIAEVHNVPISVLIRPFASVLDNVKVESLMKTIQVGYITTYSSCFHRRNQRFLCSLHWSRSFNR